MTVFDKTTKEQAELAAKKLSDKLKNPAWLTGGIGISECRKSYVIIVYIDKLSDEIRKKVPMSVDNIPVQLEETGKISAKPAKPKS